METIHRCGRGRGGVLLRVVDWLVNWGNQGIRIGDDGRANALGRTQANARTGSHALRAQFWRTTRKRTWDTTERTAPRIWLLRPAPAQNFFFQVHRHDPVGLVDHLGDLKVARHAGNEVRICRVKPGQL